MILTSCQAANILNINEHALEALVSGGQIPHIRTPAGGKNQTYFNTKEIRRWLRQVPSLNINKKPSVAGLKNSLQKQFPDAFADLHQFSKQFIKPRRGKGYSLTKVPNKKLGFVYYVRYIEDGQLVPSRWSTHTNNEEAADDFALQNREKLLSEYHRMRSPNKTDVKLFRIMKHYYEWNSPYLRNDILRGRTLKEDTRRVYHNIILCHWIPFLRKNRIKTLEEIDTPLLARFQDACLAKGNKPQTINHYTSHISNILDYFLIRGQIKTNPCKSLRSLKVGKDDQKVTGCYDLKKLKGVFNKRWENQLSYMLSILSYTTGMRNCEIELIQVKDLITVKKIHFINIPESKSPNGIRMVPLHNFVYRKLMAYIRKNNRGHEDYIFKQGKGEKIGSPIYRKAKTDLAKYTGYSDDKLKEENIRFYSGRHFWKTLMNAHDLGDVEEYFMGHKVSSDVAKLYNHKDKVGQERIARKALEVFKILDARLFITTRK